MKKRLRFSEIALVIVWAGVSLALGAVVYQFETNGAFESMTFVWSLVALLASIPVYLEKKKIDGILKRRAD